MNLLGGTTYDPAAAVSKSTASLIAMTAFDTTNLRLTVTVPSHGILLVKLRTTWTGGAAPANILMGVLDGSTVRLRVTPNFGYANSGGGTAASSACRIEAEGVITGLTPGASITLDAAYAVEVVNAGTNIKYGGPNNTTTNDAWGGFGFEVWDPRPLPTAAPGASSGLPTLNANLHVLADVKRWDGTVVAASTAGYPQVDVAKFGGNNGIFAAGRPEVNVSHIGGATAPVTNIGTVYNTDFAANYDATNDVWKTNVTHFGGTAGVFASGRPEVNTTHWNGTSVATANVRADVQQWRGSTPVTLLADGLVQARETPNYIQPAIAAGTTTTIKVGAALPFSDIEGMTGRLKVNSVLYERVITASDVVTNTYTFYPAVPTATDSANGDRIELYFNRLADVGLWQGDKVNDLISGRVDVNVQATAAALTFNLTGNITGNLSGSVGSVVSPVTVGTNNDKTGYRLSATGVDDVWDEPLAGHLTAGSTGAALNAAGSSGDPWITPLPGAYAAGQAGYILGTNLNAPVTSAKLAADGLDNISVADPGSPASMTSIPKMIVALWRRFFCKVVKDDGALMITQYADNGITVNATQTYSVTATVETVNKAT